MKCLIILSLAVAAFAWSDKARDAAFVALDNDESGAIELPELQGLFIRFDKNGDGHLRKAEFEKEWQDKTFMTKGETAIVYGLADNNKDGEIDAGEVLGTYLRFDANANGEVTKAEYDAVWIKIFT